MKRLLSLFLSFVMIILTTTCISIVNADENTSDKTIENSEIHTQSNVYEKLEQIADIYTNRYIIKYNDDISEDKISSAYSEAENQSQQTINNIKEADEDDFNEMINNINSVSEDTDDVLISEDAQQVLQTFESDSDSGEINVSELSSDIKVIELPEKVDPDVFVQSLSSDLQDDIEYVQPDYKLELSDFDDTDALDDLQENIEATDPEPVEEEESNSPDVNESNESENGTIDFDVVEIPDNSTVEEAPSSAFPEESVETEEPIEEEQETIDSIPSESPTPEINEVENNESLNLDTIYNLQDDIQSAWQITKGSGARVAVIDSKVDITHPDLVEHITNSYDIVNDSELTYDENTPGQYYHGTHVTGIIASTVPEAEIIPIAAFEDGQAYTSDIIKAIKYAEEQGAAIVNCSWGSTDNNQALKDAMQESGMLFVCAAGNNRMNVDETPIYPACYDIDNVISVTSLNQDLGFSYYSNYGEQIDIAMYGRNVYNAMPGGEYGEQSGTSMAAAYVSAGAAMAKAINADGNIKDVILNSAVSLSNLQDKVNGGRKLSYSNLVEGIVDGEIIEVTPEDDFDVNGYQRTPEENWELFNSLETVQIASGSSFALFLKSDGTVWATGNNRNGALGNGTYNDSHIPGLVVGLRDIKYIDSSGAHCVALDNNGRLYTWGYNSNGQLGDGTKNNKNLPIMVYSDTYANGGGISCVAVGGYSTLYQDAHGDVYAMGKNDYGKFGNDSKNDSSIAVKCTGWNTDYTISKIVVSMKFTLALYEDGSVYGCGSNSHYVLGDEYSSRTIPSKIYSLSDVKDIVIGTNHCFAIKNDGTVWAWGADAYGQLGDGDTIDKSTPVQIPELTNVISIVASGDHSLALKSDGSVLAWGYSSHGALGMGNTDKYYTPTQISTFLANNISYITTGMTSFAIREDGSLLAWGSNAYGEYGNGNTFSSKVPVMVVKSSQEYNKIAVGTDHILVIKDDGALYARGYNTKGQLGNGNNIDSVDELIKVSGMNDVIEVAAGDSFSVALKKDGTLWTWGQNSVGQLGDGSYMDRNTPYQILNNVSSISAGDKHVIILKNDGTVWGWGDNSYLQLNLSYGNYNIPTQIISFLNTAEIFAGGNTSAAIQSDGKVRVFGDNRYGKAGINTTNSNTGSMCTLSSLNNIVDMDIGAHHMVAVDASGNMYAWGYNFCGQLGVAEDVQEVLAPCYVRSNVDIVRAGGNTTIVRLKDGSWVQYGDNLYNKISDDKLNEFDDIRIGNTMCVGEKDLDGTSTFMYWGMLAESGNAKNNSSATPKQMKALSLMKDVYAGEDQLYSIDINNNLYTWSDGPLDTSWDVPAILNRSVGIDKVAIGKDACIELNAGGDVYGHGSNSSGSLKIGLSNPLKYTKIEESMKDVAMGEGFSVMLGDDGNVYTSGNNSKGQLGRVDNGTNATRTKIEGLSNIVSVAAGYDHAMALSSSGDVYVWGSNESGQLGTLGLTNSFEPVLVMTGCKKISAGKDFCLTIANDGSVWGWGKNTAGQLGIGNKENQSTPISITTATAQGSALNNIVEIAAGYNQSIAVTNSGDAYAWGYGNDGQLGAGQYKTSLVPQKINAVSNVSKAAAGHGFSALVDKAGQLWVFGDNSTYCFNEYVDVPTYLSDETLSGYKKLQLACTAGEEYTVRIKAQNIADFAPITFELKYDNATLELINSVAQSYTPIFSIGADDVCILNAGNGSVKFYMDKAIPSGKAFCGYVNSVKFKAKNSGITDIYLYY